MKKESYSNQLYTRDTEINALLPVMQVNANLAGKEAYGNMLYTRDVDTNALIPVIQLLVPLQVSDIEGLQTILSNKADISDLLSEISRAKAEEKRIENKTDTGLDNKADLVNGIIPADQLPSYVDQIIEGELISLTEFAVEDMIITPMSNKIYVDLPTGKTYRWGGSEYVEISASVTIGETSSTAYRGDKGKSAYDHSRITGNPHNTTKTDIGLGNADNTSDKNKPVSIAQQQAIKDAIAAIQTGGVNIISNLRSNWQQGQWKYENGAYENVVHAVCTKNYIKIYPGTDYIVSFVGSFSLGIREYREDGTFIQAAAVPILNNFHNRIVRTFKTSPDTDTITYTIFSPDLIQPVNLSVLDTIRLKIERGNLITDFSPAWQDIQA